MSIDFLEKNRGFVFDVFASWDQGLFLLEKFVWTLKTEIRPVHQIHQQIGKSV